MTVRDELERVMAEVAEGNKPYADDETYGCSADDAFFFLRDHGPALLEAVRDAARLDWLQANPHMLYTSNDNGPIDHFVAVNERKVPRSGNVAPTVREAIDKARAGK